MSRSLSPVLGVLVALTLGCVSQSTWTPTVDTFGSSRAQYLSRDMEECRALARSGAGSTGEETVRGAAIGGLIGAAAGAAIGAAVGATGKGAAVGAAAGGFGGGATGGARSQEEFKRTFRNCLRNRGHNVIG